jgi:hypothetical protein
VEAEKHIAQQSVGKGVRESVGVANNVYTCKYKNDTH